jgi:hypothetical protein
MISAILAYQLLATQIARTFPGCEHVTVYAADSLPGTDEGYVPYRSPSAVTVLKGLPASELRLVLAHECGHVVDFNLSPRRSASAPFGHPPYVTTYAKTAAIEDFAETYREIVLGRPIAPEEGKKVQAVCQVLGNVPACARFSLPH